MALIEAKLKSMEECYRIDSTLYYIPAFAFRIAARRDYNHIRLFQRNGTGRLCARIENWDYPLSFFNLPIMYLFNKVGEFHEL